ncbi:CoA-substrate-specific enzyme activase, putative [Desulfatibacillum alkenivorans DSM 16219]|jgi:predicted CoA-substrate-specific enzyme activase|uniref:CoA-substrate-specific enzyme activase, putative n=1 Tax=Desulfatibacillum alkenivorans DSM 16219 TaxID=1121393 RepID=A0A1M6N399_9BACT|nr:acyl-CoA dehydratase activase [Desulfatibacillum alkenivorans]SHJ90043.1 CoA-substrate-specific enzyme activase, putative [Desulfatibacillum alkenivorans DSM 16219]
MEKTNKTNQNASGLYSLGLCLGASTITMASINSSGGAPPEVERTLALPHEGNPRKALLKALEQFDLAAYDRITVTGRRLRNLLNLTSIPEPEAVEAAYQLLKPEGGPCQAIVSAGGETFMVYQLGKTGQVSNVLTGNKCASGTGEFFLQQLRRMNVTLEEAATWAATETPHHVSGRCSVFCKSDCTHATNKGVPKSRVTAGLCQMMANKILELLKKVGRDRIMLTGGTSQNQMMVHYLKQEIKDLVIPEHAYCYEAIGAALWGLENKTLSFPGMDGLFNANAAVMDILEPLASFEDQVHFKTMTTGEVQKGDECILGLDVGSTTTKAVLLRTKDKAMLASVYLRTNGDPVGASRQCYQAILEQVEEKAPSESVSIIGLGVCGSGRQIAGLHALTDGVINEIIAHAAAAVHFDPKVDTIFEIGGQDAKYTWLTNGVPSDYAMNEACSAGTGSFLEEAAFETLGVKMEDIAGIALQGQAPPNFNDQCAAFIASDIKNAIHEGIQHEDIVAGLTYSICMNYSNRVKGARTVGERVFMQGGVCYNRAVPLAMAALVGKPIVVPPEPGLMGAFGVGLAVQEKIEQGLMAPQTFDLKTLVAREVVYKTPFICKGGKERCDRKCEIAVIEIEGKKYPFGGACNRYYNLRREIKYEIEELDLVRKRQELIFHKYGAPQGEARQGIQRGTVGINRSFLTNTYYPLYSHFFANLGLAPVVPDKPSQKGIDAREAAFCYPGELAHGFFHTMIQSDPAPDFIFLPHFKAISITNGFKASQVCPFVQGEPFFLGATFAREIQVLEAQGTKMLTPTLDFSKGVHAARTAMVEAVHAAGIPRSEAREAFDKALAVQQECMDEMKALGAKALKALESDPDKIAVALFARPYNGFVSEAHMGIPHKIASRGVMIIPFDFLPLENERTKRHMYWGMGQLILKAARFVEKHPQLFGTFITNFSCGPDSFVVGYFRDIMGRKPSLTLELDSHTADAGLETRIEAFLDIVASYRQLSRLKTMAKPKKPFTPASVGMEKKGPYVMTSSGEKLPWTDPRVTVMLPSMGRISSEAAAAAFRGMGLNAVAHPPSDERILKLGRANTSCKECLPLILTTGTLLSYLEREKREDEILIYFMPTASGPCRFGQYHIFMEDLIKKREIPNVALFSLTAENAYAGMGGNFQVWAWRSLVTADVMEDVRSMLLACAKDPDYAMAVFEEEWTKILAALETQSFFRLKKQALASAERLGAIPRKTAAEDVPVVSLVGEIYVRRDSLSRRKLTENLAKRGIAVRCSPIAEWIIYSNYLVDKGLVEAPVTFKDKLLQSIKKRFLAHSEKRIKEWLATSGLVPGHTVDMEGIMNCGGAFISENLTGEAILTVGSALYEVGSHTCGAIAIGPFGCMPNRLSESIMARSMTREQKINLTSGNGKLTRILSDTETLPFLAIESDGSPFPQVIEAKLEAFCLRALRLHDKMAMNRELH